MEVEAKNISFSVGRNRILKSVGVYVSPGEILGLIGPNGSGKSTFLKCIYRVLHPNEGTISIHGKNLDEMSFRESALAMAVVSQHRASGFDFSVSEMVMMGRSPHKKFMERDTEKDWNIVKKALRDVGMEGFENRSFQSLSGGEQQRVILARALAQKTNIMILDEPTNHLDIRYQMQIMDVVKNLGMTVITAVHDLNIAAMYCDRLTAVCQGSVVGEGTPDTLLTSQFIWDLYGVNAVVHKYDGRIHIEYLPHHLHKKLHDGK
jgi:iron complex transport system ATP-binding protein